MNISLSPFAPEKLVSRNGLAVPSRVSLFISILRLNIMLLTYYGVPPDFRGGVHLFAIAYRWHSLPRVRRYRASKPQGSSERILPWQVIVDQLICVCVCFLPIHSGHQVRWTYQPGSHRRKVTQDF